VSSSRSGRTTSSMIAGSDPLTMKAFAGQPAPHVSTREGTG
jgi:hypothetical protein